MDDQRLRELADDFLRHSKPESLQYLERYRTVIVHLINEGRSLKQVHQFLSIPEVGVTCRYESLRRWVNKNIDLHPGKTPPDTNSTPNAPKHQPTVVDKTVNDTIDKTLPRTGDVVSADTIFPEDPMETIAKLRKQAAEQKAAAPPKQTGGKP